MERFTDPRFPNHIVRTSRNKPNMYVVAHAASDNAVVCPDDGSSYFGTPAAAWDALKRWLDVAQVIRETKAAKEASKAAAKAEEAPRLKWRKLPIEESAQVITYSEESSDDDPAVPVAYVPAKDCPISLAVARTYSGWWSITERTTGLCAYKDTYKSATAAKRQAEKLLADPAWIAKVVDAVAQRSTQAAA
jgi:hypothetical protein